MRRPNCSSIATTSPRAMRRPFTSRSTASPVIRFRTTMEPGPRSSVSRIVISVRPISTASSTGTSSTMSSPDGSAASAAGAAGSVESVSGSSAISEGTLGVSSLIGLLLDDHVGEEDVRHLFIGLRLQIFEDVVEQLLARLPLDQLVGGEAGQVVGHDRPHDGVLLEARRRALGGLGDAALHLEGDAHLAVVAAVEVDGEVGS